METVNNQTIPPSPETRAERMEAQIAEIQQQIDYSYTNRDKCPVSSRSWNLWDIAIDELIEMKEEVVKLFKEEGNNG